VIFEELGLEAGLGGSPLREHGVVSGASVSIELEKRPFGVLGTFMGKRRVLARDDASFLQSVANVLAATIERQQVEKRLRFLAESGEVSSS
jgi:GAF domain-containing protein